MPSIEWLTFVRMTNKFVQEVHPDGIAIEVRVIDDYVIQEKEVR